ncbi:zinc-dependent alcohol dehydrogenase [Marinobacter bohaiensis]|uniref:zinc-dependent alcohol dehydrogenase n=1 Tax=Marinobacter bohaiensis TaxID=2201898 RepID=UPI000DACF3C1|nr:zinc-binding alcohol dehydrogenase [Marinobacter bohaiensis]
MTSAACYRGEAFWIREPGQGDIRPVNIDRTGVADAGDVVVETLFSAVSRGTESLVFHGAVPESEYQRMRCPFQEGAFPFPVKYGYANVGRVIEGPDDWRNELVFCLYPHQTCFRVPGSAVQRLPRNVPPERAVLAANMETAVNALWDASPRVGDRIAVIGCGVVGSLVAWLASRIPGTRVQAIDPNPDRRDTLAALGVSWSAQADGPDDHDLVVHASGQPEGLQVALSLAGVEGRIVEMSWYGDQAVPLTLGGAFHSRRLSLVSSQVGRISGFQAPRWNHGERLALALRLLAAPELDALINSQGAFHDLPESLARVAAPDSGVLCHRVRY